MSQVDRDDWSCYRRFAHKSNSDFWLNLVESGKISQEDLFNRLNANWLAVGSVAGLVSGFTYIASSTGDIEFTQHGFFGDSRIHVFGLLSMLSFIVSLSATLFSSLFYGILNMMGVENTNDFVIGNWWFINAPLKMLTVSVGFMLLSALVSIGGVVDTWVYRVILAVGICFIALFAIIFARVKRQLNTKQAVWRKSSTAKRDDDAVLNHLNEEHHAATSLNANHHE